jgi:FkbM family methyltransferase
MAKIHEQKGKLFNPELEDFEECIIKLNSRNNFWYRPGTFDLNSIRECRDNYSEIDTAGKVVLDLGANIGGFARMALQKGAKQVIALEPCPCNFQLLEINVPNSFNINAAVSEEDSKDVVFHYAGSKRNSVSSSTMLRRNASGITISVPGLSFSGLLEKYKPEILKIDIEGKEYDILDSIQKIPDFVEVVGIEFHNTRKPYSEYPSRFFPETSWKKVEHPILMYGQKKVLDYTFYRRNV